jgi:phosphinothricin acetyltransferase
VLVEIVLHYGAEWTGMIVTSLMTPAHWADVRAIYLEGIATGNATFETEAPDWDRWDADHLAVGRLVAVSDGRIVGWAALSPVSRRRAYRGVAEVSVYVAAHARGSGVGTLLLLALIEAAEAAGLWTLQASVMAENIATVRLHERAGFRQVGRRERIGQRSGRWRDTLLLERRSATVATD